MNKYYTRTWDFTSNEIDQLVRFFERWNVFDHLTDKRKVASKKVRQHLITNGFMTSDWEVNDRKVSDHFIYMDMPPEGLWRIVKMMIGGQKTVGRSIAGHKYWMEYFSIWPEGHKYHSSGDMEKIVDILNTLASYDYIYFLRSASVWEVTVRK